MKEKKKSTNLQLFTHKVTDKANKEQVADYLNKELSKHVSYSKTKKNDE